MRSPIVRSRDNLVGARRGDDPGEAVTARILWHESSGSRRPRGTLAPLHDWRLPACIRPV